MDRVYSCGRVARIGDRADGVNVLLDQRSAYLALQYPQLIGLASVAILYGYTTRLSFYRYLGDQLAVYYIHTIGIFSIGCIGCTSICFDFTIFTVATVATNGKLRFIRQHQRLLSQRCSIWRGHHKGQVC